MGVGVGASLGRVGSIVAPFILLIPRPQIVLAAVSAVAAVCACNLPETQGRAIYDSIEQEIEQEQRASRSQPPFRPPLC